jgi:hypothetical protein
MLFKKSDNKNIYSFGSTILFFQAASSLDRGRRSPSPPPPPLLAHPAAVVEMLSVEPSAILPSRRGEEEEGEGAAAILEGIKLGTDLVELEGEEVVAAKQIHKLGLEGWKNSIL